MKIAAATEPECGEGQRRKLDEIFAEVDESAILELSETARFARHEKDFEAAWIAGEFVAAEGAGKIGVILERGGQDDGVFDGEAGALAEVGADRVSGIAEDGDAADDPRKRCQAILNFCADRALGVFDEFGNRSVPAGEKFLQCGGFGDIRRTQRVVGGGVPVDTAGAEAQDAEAATVAVGFGEVAVVLEAEMASLVFRVDVGHAAPDAIVAIAEFGVQAERFAHGGVNAVAGNDEIGFGGGSIFKVKKDGVGALLEAREGVIQMDGAAGHGLGERGLEFGAMNGDAVAISRGERESFDALAAGILHQKAAERAVASLEPGKDIRVNFIEGSDGVGPEAHA